MRELYERIKERLIEIPAIQYVGIFSDQFNKPQDNHPFSLPAVLVEFVDIYPNDAGSNTQEMDVTVRLHIAVLSQVEENLNIFDIRDLVNQKIQGYLGMKRTREQQDLSPDAVNVWQSEYRVTYIDNSSNLMDEYTDEVEVTIKFRSRLDIDNKIIRTGDGKND